MPASVVVISVTRNKVMCSAAVRPAESAGRSNRRNSFRARTFSARASSVGTGAEISAGKPAKSDSNSGRGVFSGKGTEGFGQGNGESEGRG